MIISWFIFMGIGLVSFNCLKKWCFSLLLGRKLFVKCFSVFSIQNIWDYIKHLNPEMQFYVFRITWMHYRLLSRKLLRQLYYRNFYEFYLNILSNRGDYIYKIGSWGLNNQPKIIRPYTIDHIHSRDYELNRRVYFTDISIKR